MRCSIAMAWSSAAAACVVGPREPLYPLASVPRIVVHRLQGRVLARQSSVLLSADGHRSCQPFISSPVRLFLLPEKSTLSLCFEAAF